MISLPSPLLGRTRLLALAVALLVPLVSMNRLEAYARSANESDALQAIELLAREWRLEKERPSGAITSLDELIEARSVHHRLRDARPRSAGTWFYHGYLFRLFEEQSGSALLVAWPRSCGNSGRAAFAATANGGILWDRNDDARYSGLDAPPLAADSFSPLVSAARL